LSCWHVFMLLWDIGVYGRDIGVGYGI
jgi:hypothetical protein